MKRTVAMVAALLLLITACSSDDESSTTTTTTRDQAPSTTEGLAPGTVTVDAWAETFCGAFSNWRSGIENVGPRAEANLSSATSQSEARDSVVALLDEALVLTTVLIDEVEGQDPPDMDGGEGVVAAFTDTFQGFVGLIETSREEVEAVEVESDSFGQQMKAIYADFQNDFAAIGNLFAEIDRQYPDPEFQLALTDACGL
ncbi:MAG: hypothetical protein ABI239_00745 [Aquihabitans sp.]